MKKFIYASCLFVLPFIPLVVKYFLFYEKSAGDLTRVGKISMSSKYRTNFNDRFNSQIYTNSFNLNSVNGNYDVLTIGDSFSQQGKRGYQNYLAYLSDLKVINFSNNQRIQNPLRILNCISDHTFLQLKIKFVILQCAERMFPQRARFSKTNCKFKDQTESESDSGKVIDFGSGIFQDIVRHSLYDLLYNFDDRAYTSQAYKVQLTSDSLFSVPTSELLFYYKDIDYLRYSTEINIDNLNNELNSIARRLDKLGIVLIVLPSPDKSDLYYDFIKSKKFTRNIFFTYMELKQKKYLYLNTRTILLDSIRHGVRDVYYADDSHWSPIGCYIVAKELHNLIRSR